MSNIENFYAGKSVLVTGATGFVGKVFVEKLLRSCTLINKVYIIIRTKRNETAHQRYKKYVEHVAFDRLNRESPEKLNKLKVISGDLSADGLGISDDNKKELINNVSVVVHSAADVRFDLTLLEILKTNVMGTYRVLQLAEQMKRLEAFVFVSTAYSQSYQLDLEEKFYPTGYKIFDVIDKVQSDDEAALEKIQEQQFSLGHSTTYTISKAFAEDLIHEYRKKLPVTVVRPSIVICAVHDPEPGFLQGFQSFTGVTAGMMTGVVRVGLVDENVTLKVIPVDHVANAIIVAAWKRSSEGSLPVCTFYNITDFDKCPSQGVLKKQFEDSFVHCSPYEKLVWYPGMTYSKHLWLYAINFFLMQLLPALLLDLILVLIGKKPFMTSLQRGIFKSVIGYSRFSMNNFVMSIEKSQQLFGQLSEVDKAKFNFDAVEIDPEEIRTKQFKGIRKFLFKEDESTIPKAQAKLKRLYFMNIAFKVILGLWICYLIKSLF